ncbi:MAG: lipocalin-like domain-containing protein [Myxococcota bacterium]
MTRLLPLVVTLTWTAACFPRPQTPAAAVPVEQVPPAWAPFRNVDDAPHPGKGGYEWWYYDALFDDGSSAVMVMWDRMMWQEGKTWQELVITDPDGKRHAFRATLPAGSMKHGPLPADGELGTFKVVEERLGEGEDAPRRYRLTASAKDESGTPIALDLTLESLLPPWRWPRTATVGDTLVMGWSVAMPRGTAMGTLTVGNTTRTVSGTAYHDHNWGDADFSEHMAYWYWGRATLGDVTLIFAQIHPATDPLAALKNRSGFPPRDEPGALLYVGRGREHLFQTDAVQITPYQEKYSVKGGRRRPERLVIRGVHDGAPIHVTLEMEREVEALDMLERGTNPLVHLLVHDYLAPAYFRMRSRAHAVFTHAGVTYERTGEGLQESMYLRVR